MHWFYVGICSIYIRIFMICKCISVATFSLGAGFCLKIIFKRHFFLTDSTLAKPNEVHCISETFGVEGGCGHST